MTFINQKKINLVNKVFSSVNKKYDIMNDIMSLGAHRIWKRDLVEWMSPNNNDLLIDVASGSGDIAKIFSEKINNNCSVFCVEPNKKMLNTGKKKLEAYKNIKWYNNYAEKLPFSDNTFDLYSISFGLRNTSDINKSLSEAFRVLKPGGKFYCLEFSKVENETINFFYKRYSKILPKIGGLVVGDSAPYEYLVKSIDNFYNQNELTEIMNNAGFDSIECRNLLYGVAAIHRGWKI